jgi:hypothetical protein
MIRTYVIVPDIHCSFHDIGYLKLISKIIRHLKTRNQIAGMVQLGDAIDFWQLSSYDKDPGRVKTVVDDALTYSAILDQWEDELPKGSEFNQLEGNHEDRLRRYVWRSAPAIAKLMPNMPTILKFDERNKRGKVKWRFYPLANWRACQLGDVYLHHGHYFNQHVAMGNLAKYRVKLITGHTHRLQYVTDGTIWAASLGHGSNEVDTSHNPVPTGWQQALALLHIVNGVGHLEILTVTNGKCCFRGEYL